jgi:PadR family transcriptional regulator, regulatory protein AphA
VSLRHALLALLEAGPSTGYELAKQFDQSVDYVWHAQHSQIYTELRRLELDRLVVAETLPRGARKLATKRAYRLTEDGLEALHRWVALRERPAPIRDRAYLKATYLEYGSFDDAREQFRAHREHYHGEIERYRRHIDELERRDTALLKRRLARAPEQAHDAIVAYKVHAYRGLLARAEAEVAWAGEGLALVGRLAGRG